MIDFKNHTRCQIAKAIDADDTTILLGVADYPKVLGDGTESFFVLIDAAGFEVVKINVPTSSANGLVVERGQGGTFARAWKSGATFYQCLSESFLNAARQHGDCRTVTSSPDGALTPAYPNERVFHAAGQNVWWQAVGSTTTWLPIAGVPKVWHDVTTKFDLPSDFLINPASWNEGGWWDSVDHDGSHGVQLCPNEDLRAVEPARMRFTHDFVNHYGGGNDANLYVLGNFASPGQAPLYYMQSSDVFCNKNYLTGGVYSGDAVEMNLTGAKSAGFIDLGGEGAAAFKVTKIEWEYSL